MRAFWFQRLIIAISTICILGSTACKSRKKSNQNNNSNGNQSCKASDPSCISDDSDNPSNMAGAITINDIQDESSHKHPSPGSEVTLLNVIAVTKPFHFGTLSGFFVSSKQGGALNGIFVTYKEKDIAVDPFEIGAVLDIVGTYEEFDGCFLESAPKPCTWKSNSQIDLKKSDIIEDGDGSLPFEPSIISKSSDLTDDNIAETYEGVLVKLENTTVTNPSAGYGEFVLDDTVHVDDTMYLYPTAKDEKIDSIAGMLHYSFGGWKLLPRGSFDISSELGCPESAVTIPMLRDATSKTHVKPNCQIELTAILTTPVYTVSPDKKEGNDLMGFFVQDQSGPYHGIQITFRKKEFSAIPDLAIGDSVNVKGIYTEFDGCFLSSAPDPCTWKSASQIEATSIDYLDAGIPIEPEEVSITDLDPEKETAESYEGVLIKIPSAKVINPSAQYGNFIIEGNIAVGPKLFECQVNPDEIIEPLIGVYSYSFGSFTLLPRSQSDIGAENECKEIVNVPNPDTGNPSDHLLVSEIAVTPTNGEFIEIYNPTTSSITLDNYYLSNMNHAGSHTYYYSIPTATTALAQAFGDFYVHFPQNTFIGPKNYMIVSLVGAEKFSSFFTITPDFEIPLLADDANIDNMIGNYDHKATSFLTNGGEDIMLFYWDGKKTSLVRDVDYVIWGDNISSFAVDKSGVNGYKNDTSIASQKDHVVRKGAHSVEKSFQRVWLSEGEEKKQSGNGITGHDETSEPLESTWDATNLASPGAAFPSSN